MTTTNGSADATFANGSAKMPDEKLVNGARGEGDIDETSPSSVEQDSSPGPSKLSEKQPLIPPTPTPPPASKRPRPQQPRFATLTLPPKYDHLSLVTRLWLQSRIPDPSEKLRAIEKAKPASRVGSSDDVKATADEPLFRLGGRRRPLTMANIWIWLDLTRVLAPYLRVALRHAHPLRLAIYLIKMVLDTLQPTIKLYAQSQLYDVVEEALRGKPASWSTALRLGSTGLIFRVTDELMSSFFTKNYDALHNWVEFALEKAYLTMQLDAPLHSTDDISPVQVYEAGVFAGMETAINYSDGPWGLVNGMGSAFAKSVDITAKVAMLVQALGGIEQLKKIHEGRKGTRTGVLLLLAFAPTILQQFRERAYQMVYDAHKDEPDVPDYEYQLDSATDMARSGHYKQEVILFGLRDWVLKRWEEARALARRSDEENPDASWWIGPLFGSAEDLLRTVFYVLLATKTINTGLTLGSIHLYQSTTSGMIWSVRSLKRSIDQAFQSVFYAGAFVSALEPVIRGPMIDYDTVRVAGGMRIEARNLSFTYIDAPEPTLSGINLVVEQGETLAIVGYNGGGKTTLVKVLMGLFPPDENGGQLLLNGRPVADYDMATVHRRQSVLFQDFAKYPFSLKDNVALGDVARGGDLEAINAAIDAGGAQAIREKAGLEGTLDPYNEPQSFKSRAVNWFDAEHTDDESDDDEDESESESEREEEEAEKEDKKEAAEAAGEKREEEQAEKSEEKVEEKTEGGEGASTPTSTSSAPNATGASTPKKEKKKKNRPERTALSGGQWQRVGLARAFMRAGEADLVIFDEPSAALDPRAEAELFANIHGLSRAAGSTTIYISHRFNTVRKADKIALVDGGHIAEYGTHAELMALKGQYYDLFTTQAEGYLG